MKYLVGAMLVAIFVVSGCSTAPPASEFGYSQYYRSGFNSVHQGMTRTDLMAAMADYHFIGRHIEGNQESLIFEDTWSSQGGSLYNKYYIGVSNDRVSSARIQFHENKNQIIYIFGF